MLAYHIETEGRSGEDGNFIPLDLAPLNIEPSHVEIAHRALTAGDGVDERLDIDDGETRLAFLRSDEREPPPCPVDLASFIEAANDRLTKCPERERARWLERLAELLILDGHPDSARSLLDEAVALAGDAGDLATMVNADIRLKELKDAEAGELRAWRWVAQLTWPRGRTHLEIPFLYLGSFALRRNRMREAEAYYRRALLLCDDPARGLSIRSAMAIGFRPTVPA
ncbi:MAG: hypothetical protein ACRDWH_00755 [Acidimicrobiia bacterium]